MRNVKNGLVAVTAIMLCKNEVAKLAINKFLNELNSKGLINA